MFDEIFKSTGMDPWNPSSAPSSPEPLPESSRGDKIKDILRALAVAVQDDSSVQDVQAAKNSRMNKLKEERQEKEDKAWKEHERKWRMYEALERMKDRQHNQRYRDASSARADRELDWRMQGGVNTGGLRTVPQGEMNRYAGDIASRFGVDPENQEAMDAWFNYLGADRSGVMSQTFEKSRQPKLSTYEGALDNAVAASGLPEGGRFDSGKQSLFGVDRLWKDKEPGIVLPDGTRWTPDVSPQVAGATQQPQQAIGTQTNPATVNTQQEYDALPVGAWYLGSDGTPLQKTK